MTRRMERERGGEKNKQPERSHLCGSTSIGFDKSSFFYELSPAMRVHKSININVN